MTDPTPTPHDRDGALPPVDLSPSSPTETWTAAAPDDVEGDRNHPPRGALRQAVRSDVRRGLGWAGGRLEATREHIRQAPARALAYGLGLGVILGLTLRR